MTAVTLFIATVACLAAFFSRPGFALAIYCATLVLCPPPLSIQIGPADFSISRICILAVLANATLRSGRHRYFEWAWVDVFILAAWGLGLFALLQTFPAIALERHAGTFFDTILPYIAARLIVTSQEELVTLIKSLAVVVVPIVVLAVAQMLSGTNPVSLLLKGYPSGVELYDVEANRIRLGLHRPNATLSHPIPLGLFSAMVGTLTLTLWRLRVWSHAVVAILVGIAGLGLFSSLSSGPLLAAVGAAMVFLVRADWRLATGLGVLAVLSTVSISAYSGEPYVDVLAGFAYHPRTVQFRLDLFREAFGGGMDGHWWTGYGYVGVGPGTDNTHFHWKRTDFVNMYIQILVRTGLLGLVPFLFANGFYYVRLIRALRIGATPEANWMAWCMLAAMVGWNFGLMAVGAVAPILQLLYVFIAISTNMPLIVTVKAPRAS